MWDEPNPAVQRETAFPFLCCGHQVLLLEIRSDSFAPPGEGEDKSRKEKGPDSTHRSALGHPVSRQHGEGGKPGRGGHRA